MSCYPFESLVYRSIALCRIAQILDSVLHLVSGPSVLAEQSFCPNRYRLESFTESSFISSWLCMETCSTQSPVCKRKDGVTESEGKEDHAVKDGRNNHQEAHLKRTKPSLASLEKFQEQLKAVKRKVCMVMVMVFKYRIFYMHIQMQFTLYQ